MKKFIPFFITFLLIYYVLPLLIKSTVILLTLTPIFLLIISIIFGGLFGFSIFLAIMGAVCALPLILTAGTIFFIPILVFFVVTIFGNLLGLIFRKKT